MAGVLVVPTSKDCTCLYLFRYMNCICLCCVSSTAKVCWACNHGVTYSGVDQGSLN